MADRTFRSRPGAPMLDSLVEEPLGDRLKGFFDGVMTGPMPDRLARLADELEAGLERGDLAGSKRARPSAGR